MKMLFKNGNEHEIEIRTDCDRMCGTLNLNNFTFNVIDGKISRVFQIPDEGMLITYMSAWGEREPIRIPPRSYFI